MKLSTVRPKSPCQGSRRRTVDSIGARSGGPKHTPVDCPMSHAPMIMAASVQRPGGSGRARLHRVDRRRLAALPAAVPELGIFAADLVRIVGGGFRVLERLEPLGIRVADLAAPV